MRLPSLSLRELHRIHHLHFVIKLVLFVIVFPTCIGIWEGVKFLNQWWEERPKIAADAWQTFAVPDSDLVLSMPGVPTLQSAANDHDKDRVTDYRLDRSDTEFKFGVGWLEPVKGSYNSSELWQLTLSTRSWLEKEVLRQQCYSKGSDGAQQDRCAGRLAWKLHLRTAGQKAEVLLYVFLSERESAKRAYFIWMSGPEIDPRVGDAVLFFKSVSLPPPSNAE